MKSWLRFFGLSFFSDKIAKEARIRGVLNCVLGFVFALIFIFCGLLAANTVPFYPHYNNASEFQAFLLEAIGNSGLTVADKHISADGVINTYLSESDRDKYGQNGYNLVIDTRPVTALDDFEAYCVAKDGSEITYEAYLGLSDEDKTGYSFRIRYTPTELILTEELVAGYEAYLNASEDEEIKRQFAGLSESKGNVSAEEYDRSVYALYVSAYYPDITAYERAGEVPLLRSYYYRNYLNDSEVAKSLFIFDDVLFGFFDTDGGVAVNFYGYYDRLADGKLTADGAEAFIKDAFGASVPVSTNVYLMNIFRFIPFFALIPIVLALIVKLVLVLIKDEKYKKFTTCLKIEFSYLAVGSLVSALIMFVCGFFVSSATLNSLPLILFAAVLTARTVVLLIYEYITVKHTPVKVPDDTEAEEAVDEAASEDGQN